MAATDFTILLEGESGVGKELVARQIHDLSRRRNGPFVAINCAALVETLLEAELFGIEDRTATGVRGRRGKFEAADGGTLFLDEVSDLSLSAQAKLLRTIQDLAVERVGGNGTHRVDIRIIAATNRNLEEAVKNGRFREDLYYRLNVVRLRLPPLRERPEDVPELAEHFLRKYCAETGKTMSGISTLAIDTLCAHRWPGNVRELENAVERAVVLGPGPEITADDLGLRPRSETGSMSVAGLAGAAGGFCGASCAKAGETGPTTSVAVSMAANSGRAYSVFIVLLTLKIHPPRGFIYWYSTL